MVVMLVVVIVAAALLAILVMVVMLVVVIVAAALLAIFMMVVMLVRMTAYRAYILEKLLCELVLTLHSGKDLLAVDIIPGSGNDGSLVVKLLYHCHSSCKLFLGKLLGTAENDGLCAFDLVLVELAEILHIHFDLGCIGNSSIAVEADLSAINIHHSLDDIGKLANARGLDKDTVRAELLQHLLQSLAEITYKRTAYTALVHLGDFDTCVLHKSAVNADLAELVLDKHELLTGVCFLEQLLYESGLTCSEKA